jgi:hypothetical protein
VKPLKTAEELRAANRTSQKRFYDKRKEIAERFAAFPISQDEFILRISERVVENGKPVRVVRLALLLQWARETGIIR